MHLVSPFLRPYQVEGLEAEEWLSTDEEKLEKWKCVRSHDMQAWPDAGQIANGLVVQMHSP